jgi:hypothetical protein
MGITGVKSIWSLAGDPGPTTKITVTDSVQTLSQLGVLLTLGDEPVRGALITCETNDCRFAVGGATPSANSSTGHVLEAGGSIRLSNSQWVNTFKVINKTASSAAVLQVTLEF